MEAEKILLGHGSGGRMMHELVAKRIAPAFEIAGLADSAVLDRLEAHEPGSRLALTTDSYVVSPLFFPGGDIGDLAVNGTVNDLAMVGARPLYLTAGFIIEEGLAMSDLDRIIASMARAAHKAGVRIVAGDTKVVERGKGDGIFINTAGVGLVPQGRKLCTEHILPGDAIILSGALGNHGVAVMAERGSFRFDPPVLSDTAPLNGLVEAVFGALPPGSVRVMRDPTRGGLATTLKEFATACTLSMQIEEEALLVDPQVRGACDLLGLDPLYVANEGLMLAVVDSAVSKYCLDAMRAHGLGQRAAIIGRVSEAPKGSVLLRTSIGGSRLMDMLPGAQLPRIC